MRRPPSARAGSRPASANRTSGLPPACGRESPRGTAPQSTEPQKPRTRPCTATEATKPRARPSTALGLTTTPHPRPQVADDHAQDYTHRLLDRLQDAHGTCASLRHQLEKQRLDESGHADQHKRHETERHLAQAQISALRGDCAKMKKQVAVVTETNHRLQDDILYWEFERSNEQVALQRSKDIIAKFIGNEAARQEGEQRIKELLLDAKTYQAQGISLLPKASTAVQAVRGRVVCDQFRTMISFLRHRLGHAWVIRCFSLWHWKYLQNRTTKPWSYGTTKRQARSRSPDKAGAGFGTAHTRGQGRSKELLGKYNFLNDKAQDHLILSLCWSAWIQSRMQAMQEVLDRSHRFVHERQAFYSQKAAMETQVTTTNEQLMNLQKERAALRKKNNDLKQEVKELKGIKEQLAVSQIQNQEELRWKTQRLQEERVLRHKLENDLHVQGLQVDKDRESFSQEIKILHTAVDESRRETNSVKLLLSEARKKIWVLEGHLEKAAEHNAHIAEQLARSREEKLDMEKASVKERMKRIKEKAASTQDAESAELKSQSIIDELQTELTKAVQDGSEALLEVSSLQGQLDHQIHTREKLESHIHKLLQAAKAQNLCIGLDEATLEDFKTLGLDIGYEETLKYFEDIVHSDEISTGHQGMKGDTEAHHHHPHHHHHHHHHHHLHRHHTDSHIHRQGSITQHESGHSTLGDHSGSLQHKVIRDHIGSHAHDASTAPGEAVAGRAVETSSAAVQTMANKCKWDVILEKLRQALRENYEKSGHNVYEFIELWSLDQEFAYEATFFVHTEEQATKLIQEAWRFRRQQKRAHRLNHSESSVKAAVMAELQLSRVGEQAAAEKHKEELRRKEAKFQAAFESTQGSHFLEKYSVPVGKLIQDLKEARPYTVRQDQVFEAMDVDELLHACVVKAGKLEREVQLLADATGGEVQGSCKVKARDKARSIAKRQFADDYSQITDCLRLIVTYPCVKSLYGAVEYFINKELQPAPHCEKGHRLDFYILEIQDRVQKPVNGYRDVVIKWVVDGLVAEIQLHFDALYAEKGGKRNYHFDVENMYLGSDMLLVSSMRGNTHTVERLARALALKGNNARDQYGRCAMHYCCQLGMTSSVSLLTFNGGDLWVGDATGGVLDFGTLPVELAMRSGHIELIRFVLKKMVLNPPPEGQLRRKALKRFVQGCALWWVDFMAGATDAHDMTTELLDYEDFDTRESWLAIGHQIMVVIREWDEYRVEEEALEYYLRATAGEGHAPRVRAFLTLGVSAIGHNRTGKRTALDKAIECGQIPAAHVLGQFLESHVNIACHRPKFQPGISSHLFEAAQMEDADYAMAALYAGADPNKAMDGNGQTALMIFGALGNVKVCEALLERKADACLEDKYGCRASHYALAMGHEKKGMPDYLMQHETRKPSENLVPIGHVSEIAREGCTGAVWRYVAELSEDVSLESDLNRALGVGTKPTPLMMAVAITCQISKAGNPGGNRKDNSEIVNVDPKGLVVRALLFWKADPSIPDTHGETPLHLAAQRQHVDMYNELFVSLTLLRGGKFAEKVIATQQNRMGDTPASILESQRTLTRHRQDAKDGDDKMVLRMIFAFWGIFRRTLQHLYWTDLYDMRNTQLESHQRKTIRDLTNEGDFTIMATGKRKKKKKSHLKDNPPRASE